MMMKNVKASKSANGKRCNRSVASFPVCLFFPRKMAEGLPLPLLFYSPPFPSTLTMIKCGAEFFGEASTHFVGQ